MKIINKTFEAVFIERINRFEAYVLLDNRNVLVHVPNTGRCKELLIKGAKVILEERINPKRKTPYELIIVYKNSLPISIDSQIPNKIVEESIKLGLIPELRGYDNIAREVRYGRSRFDLCLKGKVKPCYIEIKGVTLEKDGIAMFPDAPTERGLKHLFELIDTCKDGYRAVLFFLIQMEEVYLFTPNKLIDKKFSLALAEAWKNGVEVIAYSSFVFNDEIRIGQPVKVIIE